MFVSKKKLLIFVFFLSIIVPSASIAEETEMRETLEQIKKDLSTLEIAVYSDSFTAISSVSNDSTNSSLEVNFDQNSEEVLTRHLLKLSEIEKQFQELTNKFEEINFKLDKLSTRLSKIQADSQLRFQQIENKTILNNLFEDIILIK